MLVYEKKDNSGVRHLYGTMGHVPADNDPQLTYKDNDGDVITPVEKDTYRDNSKDKIQRIVRESDGKAVNVFIGNTCIIGKVEEPSVKSIRVKTKPNKTFYLKGETLNLTGLVIEATYIDGDKKVVTGYTTSPANGDTLNDSTLTKVDVTFGGKATSFDISVKEAVSSIAFGQAEYQYGPGSASKKTHVKDTDLKVTATFSDSTTKNVNTMCEYFKDNNKIDLSGEGYVIGSSFTLKAVYGGKDHTTHINWNI